MNKSLIILLISCFLILSIDAQEQKLPLDVKQINNNAKRLINGYGHFLEQLTISTDTAVKTVYIKNILHLFNKDAQVSVSNARRNELSQYGIESYLRNVVSNYSTRYRYIMLTFHLDFIDCNSLIAIKDASGKVIMYKGTYQYTQGFCARQEAVLNGDAYDWKNPDNYDYCDYTKKQGDFFLERNDDHEVGEAWTVKLGDIVVKHTENLKTGGT